MSATCRICGCTDDDCSQCIAATGEPCSWVEPDLCTRCDDLVDVGHWPPEARWDRDSPCYGCRERYEAAAARWIRSYDGGRVLEGPPDRPACPCVLHGRGAVRC